MLTGMAQFLLDVFVHGFAGVLLLRFWLHWLRVPLRNSIGEFVMALTDFIVLRTRRFIPSAGRLDSSTLLLALLIELLYLSLTWLMQVHPDAHFPLPGLLAWSAVELVKLCVYFLIIAVVAQAILSWVNPHTPLAPLLSAITERFLQPLRSRIPLIGNVDLSPLLLLVICQVILLVSLAMLENMVKRLL